MTKAERAEWLEACRKLAADGEPVSSEVLKIAVDHIDALEAQVAGRDVQISDLRRECADLYTQADIIVNLRAQLAQRDERIRAAERMAAYYRDFFGNDPAALMALEWLAKEGEGK